MTTTPRVAATDWAAAQASPWTAHNEALRRLEAGSGRYAVADRVTAPPGSCADGACYIIIATATGAFAGKENQIATAVGANAASGWLYTVPGTLHEGVLAYVQDEDADYKWSGSAWASVGAPGGLTAADIATTNAGTSTTTAVTPDGLAGSNFGTATISLLVSDPAGSAITVGDGKAYWRVPSTLNGMDLVSVAAALTAVSSSGIPTVQIHNLTQAADMLTTKLTIDASETDSSTAAAAAVIDTANDDVATGDMLRIDIDVAGTGAKGLMVEMQFRLP